jgi:hypothetical protein
VTPLRSRIRALRTSIASGLSTPDANRSGCSYAVTVITPIVDRDQAEALRTELSKLGHGKHSPLHGNPDVQFARWVVIDQLLMDWKRAPKPPPTLTSPYLLFSADLTAPAYRADRLPDSFFRDLAARIPDVCNAVWGKCLNCPNARTDPDLFVGYLTGSQIRMGLYYARFPDLTGDEIAAALSVREQFARFARDHQRAMLQATSHHKLRSDYLTESAKWIL